jgi:hypothetical protein
MIEAAALSRVAGIQSPHRRLLPTLRSHLLDRKRLTRDPTVAKPGACPLIFGRPFIITSRRIIHAGILLISTAPKLIARVFGSASWTDDGRYLLPHPVMVYGSGLNPVGIDRQQRRDGTL